MEVFEETQKFLLTVLVLGLLACAVVTGFALSESSEPYPAFSLNHLYAVHKRPVHKHRSLVNLGVYAPSGACVVEYHGVSVEREGLEGIWVIQHNEAFFMTATYVVTTPHHKACRP